MATQIIDALAVMDYLKREIRIMRKQQSESHKDLVLYFDGVIQGYEIIVGKIEEGSFLVAANNDL